MGKVFDELFANKSFYYYGKEIPVKSLGLSSEYLMRFCAYVSNNIYMWRIDGITYGLIRSIRGVGDKKAKAIAEALVKQGVKITDIPKRSTNVIIISYRGARWKCSNCNAILTGVVDFDGRYFNFCPMCGKKLTW